MDRRVALYQDKRLFPQTLGDLLASRLSVVPREALFFDDVFGQLERQVARLHQDMRTATLHLGPRPLVSQSSQDLRQRLERLRSVCVTAEDGSRQLDMTLDMSSFKPREITVKVKDETLIVRASHAETDQHSALHHLFERHFHLPEGTDVNGIHASLSKDGILSIKGPLPKEGTKVIPIALEYKKD